MNSLLVLTLSFVSKTKQTHKLICFIARLIPPSNPEAMHIVESKEEVGRKTEEKLTGIEREAG